VLVSWIICLTESSRTNTRHPAWQNPGHDKYSFWFYPGAVYDYPTNAAWEGLILSPPHWWDIWQNWKKMALLRRSGSLMFVLVPDCEVQRNYFYTDCLEIKKQSQQSVHFISALWTHNKSASSHHLTSQTALSVSSPTVMNSPYCQKPDSPSF